MGLSESDIVRLPPYSEEAEMGAIGAVLLDAFSLMPLAARMRLKAESFYVPAWSAVWWVVAELFADGKPVDALTVAEELRRRGELEKVGGAMALDRCIDACPVAAHGEYYLGIVRAKWLARRVIETAKEVEREARDEADVEKLIRTVPERFMGLVEGGVRDKTNREEMQEQYADWEAIHRKEKRAGIALPPEWERLGNAWTLEPGLIIVAGRPSEGKTTLEDNISCWAASQGVGVARLTMDMTRRRLLARAMGRTAGVSVAKLKFGYAGESNFAKIRDAIEVIGSWPMYINDQDNELRAICSWLRARHMRDGIGLITLDYVQQVTDARASDWSNENAVITKVSRTLKALGLELRVPVLLVSQLNRDAEKASRPPKMSDLRGSGSLEQDATAILLVYRDPKVPMEWDRENKKSPTWVDLVKNQDGETGSVEFWFYRNYFRFAEAPAGAFDSIRK